MSSVELNPLPYYKSSKPNDPGLPPLYPSSITIGPGVFCCAHKSPIPTPECIMEREKKGGFYTTVKWSDGTYTTVKASQNDSEDRSPYMAFCAALAKKLYGSNAAVHRTVNRHMEKELEAQKKKKAAEKLAERKREEQRLHNLAVKRLQKKYKLEAEAKNMLDENKE